MGVEGAAIVGRRLTNESNHTAAQAGGLLADSDMPRASLDAH